MRFYHSLLPVSLALLFSGVSAAPHISSLEKKSITNTATTRSTWGDYDLSTDYYTEAPDTGDTVEVCAIINWNGSPTDSDLRFGLSLSILPLRSMAFPEMFCLSMALSRARL